MTFIDLCAACSPVLADVLFLAITDGHCARCGKRSASPDLARHRVELPPERRAFILLLRTRRMKLQLRRLAEKEPAHFAEIAEGAINGPPFWPVIKRHLDRKAPS